MLLILLTSWHCICQLNELKQSQQKLLADKEEATAARLTNFDFTHKYKLSGDLITVVLFGLWSSKRHHLVVPRHRRSTLGRRAFSVAGPMAWNAMPDDLWQFQEDAKDASVSEFTWTLSALEALCNALYKFKSYLLTYFTHKYKLSGDFITHISMWAQELWNIGLIRFQALVLLVLTLRVLVVFSNCCWGFFVFSFALIFGSLVLATWLVGKTVFASVNKIVCKITYTLYSENNTHFCFLTLFLEKVTNLNENFRQNS